MILLLAKAALFTTQFYLEVRLSNHFINIKTGRFILGMAEMFAKSVNAKWLVITQFSQQNYPVTCKRTCIWNSFLNYLVLKKRVYELRKIKNCR